MAVTVCLAHEKIKNFLPHKATADDKYASKMPLALKLHVVLFTMKAHLKTST